MACRTCRTCRRCRCVRARGRTGTHPPSSAWPESSARHMKSQGMGSKQVPPGGAADSEQIPRPPAPSASHSPQRCAARAPATRPWPDLPHSPPVSPGDRSLPPRRPVEQRRGRRSPRRGVAADQARPSAAPGHADRAAGPSPAAAPALAPRTLTSTHTRMHVRHARRPAGRQAGRHAGTRPAHTQARAHAHTRTHRQPGTQARRHASRMRACGHAGT